MNDTYYFLAYRNSIMTGLELALYEGTLLKGATRLQTAGADNSGRVREDKVYGIGFWFGDHFYHWDKFKEPNSAKAKVAAFILATRP